MKRLYYSVKGLLKVTRWRLRRTAMVRRYGREKFAGMPVVFGNAIPKAGSHLLYQILQGLTHIGPLVTTGFPPVNRGEDNRKLSPQETLQNIRRMQPGDIGYGYVHCKPPFIEPLTASGMAMIFIYRDPRDVVVSAVKYATYMKEDHGMHEYLTQNLSTDEERINLVIRGLDQPGLEYNSIRQRYENFLGWLEQPGVLCLRFEDLILDQQGSFSRLLDYLAGRGFSPDMPRNEAIEMLGKTLQPDRSGTFRKGQPGSWKESFSDANKVLFKQVAGDLLIRLGYEDSEDW
jgi:hypothetical protein